MKPTAKKKLSLDRSTVRVLSGDKLELVAGAGICSTTFKTKVETQCGSCSCHPCQATEFPPCVPQSNLCESFVVCA